MVISAKLTVGKIMSACRSNMEKCTNYGFCTKCGRKVNGVEPDAREYTCEKCKTPTVYGAEKLLMYVC
jgi:NADH pyrophosphatase NudC (nudix superfamily)